MRSRVERYSWHAFSRDLRYLGPIDWFEDDGSLDLSISASIRLGGSVTARRIPADVSLNDYRFQPRYESGGRVMPLGLFRARPTGAEWWDRPSGGEVVGRTLSLYDRTLSLQESAFAYTYALPSGTNVVDAVRDIIASTGESVGAITDSDVVTRIDQSWEPGVTKLSIVNALLSSVGFFALWCDWQGDFRVERNPGVASRPTVWSFTGVGALHRNRSSLTEGSIVPNVVIAVSQSTGDEPALVAEARNEDPSDPNSTVNVGNDVVKVYENVDAATQEALQSYANSQLASASFSGRVWDREMAVPFIADGDGWVTLSGNDVVQGPDRREVVEKLSLSLRPGSLLKVTSREVSGG